jgi:hypothetical protein
MGTQSDNAPFYPRHGIDPAKKTIEWGKQYARAAYFDFTNVFPKTVFYNAGGTYEENRLYAMGKQPINPYKKWAGVNMQTNETNLNIDWSVRPVVCTYRDKAISRLIDQEYGIVATPIDITAKAELDKYYQQMKVKIAMRQLMQQQNPELANHPLLAAQPGEPMDMEELEMRIDFGEQFNRAKDAEEAIAMGFFENGNKEFRKKCFEDWFDCGVAGYREWLGEDNKPKYRNVNVECVITNYCRWKDFRDLVHAGEVIDVALVDLATLTNSDGSAVFNETQLQEMASHVAGKWNNPPYMTSGTNYFKGYDKFHVKVLDLEFFSWNDYAWEMSVDRFGNLKTTRASYDKRKSKKNTSKRFKVVYHIKWVVGTDYAYDFGMAQDRKTLVNGKKKAETTLSYKFYAPSFYEMRAESMMDRLRPLIDDYQRTIYKIQNLKNRIVPSGWWIDLDALEDVALNKGGKAMSPKELLKMFYETGVLVGRSKDALANNNNYKPVIPIANSIAGELTGLYQDLALTIQSMEFMTGFNPVTTGQASGKTLVPGYEQGEKSTQDSLAPIASADKWLQEQLAADVLIRMKQGIKKGGIEGYAPAFNTNTLRFVQMSNDLPLRDHGIVLEEKTTDDQRQLLMQLFQQDMAQGLLDTADAIYIMNTMNVKQAQMIMAYRVKKNKQAQQQNQMALNQQTIQGQQQSAAQSDQGKAKLLQLEYDLKLQVEKEITNRELQKMQLQLQGQAGQNQATNQQKTLGHILSANAKIVAAGAKEESPSNTQ